MPKYIDAERFKLWLQENYAPRDRYFIDIDAQPTADVVERKVGKWTEKDACSECGCQPWYERDIRFLKYCPNCGARMKSE